MEASTQTGQAVLPSWQPGTVAVLCANGPHTMPVSTAIRASDQLLLVALARRRETLARLRDDSRACLCLFAEGLAFTAYGWATVACEHMRAAEHVAAVSLRIERVTDHLIEGRTQILSGVSWRLREQSARAKEAEIVAELCELGRKLMTCDER